MHERARVEIAGVTETIKNALPRVLREHTAARDPRAQLFSCAACGIQEFEAGGNFSRRAHARHSTSSTSSSTRSRATTRRRPSSTASGPTLSSSIPFRTFLTTRSMAQFILGADVDPSVLDHPDYAVAKASQLSIYEARAAAATVARVVAPGRGFPKKTRRTSRGGSLVSAVSPTCTRQEAKKKWQRILCLLLRLLRFLARRRGREFCAFCAKFSSLSSSFFSPERRAQPLPQRALSTLPLRRQHSRGQ